MMPTVTHLKNTQRMETANILNRDAGRNTPMFLRIDLGPNSCDLAVINCSIFGMLRDRVEVMIDHH